MTDTLITGAETNPAGGEADATSVKTEATTPDAKVTDAPVENKDAPADKPIAYEFKLPDGMELDQAQTDEFKAIAQKLKLPADEAQKLVDLVAKRETARTEAHVAQVAQWAESVKTDKEIGGDKLTETIATAKKAIDLGPPELKALLNESGLGNHPAVVKWAYAVGKALSEDKFVPGSKAPASTQKSIEERLYPNSH